MRGGPVSQAYLLPFSLLRLHRPVSHTGITLFNGHAVFDRRPPQLADPQTAHHREKRVFPTPA